MQQGQDPLGRDLDPLSIRYMKKNLSSVQFLVSRIFSTEMCSQVARVFHRGVKKI